uniref:Uncharacterized protein n=1 Tax=Chromera velia CCMP2878 TaxID=1169474 RepID=A0A0G4I9R0_9ALVE|eukprot:Cvel_12312.t1-p1 / transcript=Cvel_12312.t1 / gene=Cvel_12312 / organism=Chromera_velia_CCMP2878 / gene_product=hypothetical protein / transcript_product=hypothetical protein / location=Cvel_scaffold800:35025-37829(-) / protein_length=550 / sequence_SO=supercontig / SO=protein_coding / is_pseudo=false
MGREESTGPRGVVENFRERARSISFRQVEGGPLSRFPRVEHSGQVMRASLSVSKQESEGKFSETEKGSGGWSRRQSHLLFEDRKALGIVDRVINQRMEEVKQEVADRLKAAKPDFRRINCRSSLDLVAGEVSAKDEGVTFDLRRRKRRSKTDPSPRNQTGTSSLGSGSNRGSEPDSNSSASSSSSASESEEEEEVDFEGRMITQRRTSKRASTSTSVLSPHAPLSQRPSLLAGISPIQTSRRRLISSTPRRSVGGEDAGGTPCSRSTSARRSVGVSGDLDGDAHEPAGIRSPAVAPLGPPSLGSSMNRFGFRASRIAPEEKEKEKDGEGFEDRGDGVIGGEGAGMEPRRRESLRRMKTPPPHAPALRALRARSVPAVSQRGSVSGGSGSVVGEYGESVGCDTEGSRKGHEKQEGGDEEQSETKTKTLLTAPVFVHPSPSPSLPTSPPFFSPGRSHGEASAPLPPSSPLSAPSLRKSKGKGKEKGKDEENLQEEKKDEKPENAPRAGRPLSRTHRSSHRARSEPPVDAREKCSWEAMQMLYQQDTTSSFRW